MITEVFIAVDRDEVYRATLPPGEYIIGRDADAQIRIDHPTISRRHAKLIVEDDHLVLTDLESGNGTMIEETTLSAPSHLYEGQTARLGDVLLRARQNVTAEVLPSSIRNYRKGDIVAAGGMGAIHEARQSAMGRKVAMKVMLRDECASGLRRFINEARITGMLEHPNIVPVHELGVDADGRAFYTMKFVHGTTMAEVLAGLCTGHAEAVKKYPLSFLLTVFQKICDAIAFAHSRGVHHRDLKPENVMIGDFGEVLVMDWGLSKETGFASDAEDVLPDPQSGDGTGWRTMEGSVLGTPAYMSPEQARGEINAVDERSDIYCLGTILHEMIYLQPPVSGRAVSEIVDRVARGEVDPARAMKRLHLPGGKVPPSLEAVRRKAMAFDPERRYQRVTDLQADLTAYQSGFATSAESASIGKHLMLFIKRNKGVSISVLAGLLLLIGSSVWFTSSLLMEQKRVEEQKLINEQKSQELQWEGEKRLQAEQSAGEHRLRAARESTGKEAALAEAEEAKMSSEERQKRIDETERDLAEDADGFAKLARRAVAEGRVNDAVQLAGTSVQYAPDNPDYIVQNGRILLAVGRFAEAAVQFEQAAQVDPAAPVAADREMASRLQASVGSSRSPATETLVELERFFMGQGQASYVRLIDAAARASAGQAVEAATTAEAGPEAIKQKLGALVLQPGWRGARLVGVQGGGYALDLSGMDLAVLPDLADTGVVELDLGNTAVDNISALRGLSLRSLKLRGTQVADLGPLRNMPELRELECAEIVADLSPLRGAPLEVLDLRGSRVVDLDPLRQARLRVLRLNGCDIESFDPVADHPIEELAAAVGTRADFRPLARMTQLRKLELPAHARNIDAEGLTQLTEVVHPGLRGDGPITGEDYRELERLRKAAWAQYVPELQRAGVKNLDPGTLMVRDKTTGFDLDLRGTEISNLRPLAQMPLHRLWLDTSGAPLDVEPLATHPTLRHLSLEGAYVPKLGRLAGNRQLLSLAVSRDAADAASLADNKGLERLGYALDDSGQLPSGTVAEFFAPRVSAENDAPAPQGEPRLVFRFDDPAKSTEGWSIEDGGNPGPAPLWMADPVVEGGRGGGHFTFYERKGNSLQAFFVAPPGIIKKARRDLYDGLLEFQLRVGREVKENERVSVVLEGANLTLHHTSTMRPREKWRTFLVPLTVAGGWTLDKAGRLLASPLQLREALARLDKIKIQAEYAADALDERTDLDDVRLWDAASSAARNARLPGQAR